MRRQILVVIVACCTLAGAKGQLRVGDPGITVDMTKVNANLDDYPQMERWGNAGVRGGIPFYSDFDVIETISAGTDEDIQEAIDLVATKLSQGQLGLVFMFNGSYDLRSEVSMKSNVSLQGESREGVVCTINFQEKNGFHFKQGVSMSGISNMTIQGGWGQPKYDWNYSIPENDEMPNNENMSVKFTRSIDCWLDKVNIINSGRDPMRCDATHTTFRDLFVDGAHRKAGGAQGYFFIQDGDNLITGCEMTRLRHISLQGGGVEYNVVYQNDFRQEVSFHTGDDGNNLIEDNIITLPEDMPPVDAGGPFPEVNTNKPNYFAIMGPWSTQHTVSANPNFLFKNQCLQLNHDFGSSTPWSDPDVVYSGPIKIGRTPDDHINNFPVLSDTPPEGNTLYPITGVGTEIAEIGVAPIIHFQWPQSIEQPEGLPILVESRVYDDHKVDSVQLFVGNELISTKYSAPFIWNGEGALQDLSAGDYQLKLVATDDEGLSREKTFEIEVVDQQSNNSFRETFSKMTLIDWGSETYIGDGGWEWSVQGKGISGDIQGKGIYYNKQITGINSGTLTGGIDQLSVQCLNRFSSAERNIELLVNGNVVATGGQAGTALYTVAVDNLNISGDFTISIRNASGTAGEEERYTTSFDNIEWTTLDAVNTVPLAVVFESPFNGQAFAESEAIVAEAITSTGVNVSRVSLSVNGELISDDTEAPFVWESSAIAPSLKVGFNSLKLVAEDASGNSVEQEITITRGVNQAPSVRFITPINDGEIEEGQGIEIEVMDDGDLSESQLFLDGVLIEIKSEAPFGWDSSDQLPAIQELDEGSHLLRVNAKDAAGLTTSRAISFLVVKAGPPPPVIDIGNPTQEGIYAATNFDIEISVTSEIDLQKAELFLDDQLISTIQSAPFSWDENSVLPALENLDPGDYVLKVEATDVDSQVSEKSVDFSIIEVSNGPLIVFRSPSQNEQLGEPVDLKLDIQVVDEVSLVSAELFLNNILIDTKTASPFSWNSTDNISAIEGLSAGDYELKVNAENEKGDTAEEALSFRVNAFPVVEITNPSMDDVFDEPATVLPQISASDASGLSSLELFLNDQLLATRTNAPFTWDDTDVFEQLEDMPAGSYALTVVAVSNIGLITRDSIVFMVNGSPSIDIGSPANATIRNEPADVLLEIEVEDDLALTSVDLYLNDALIDSKEASPFGWDEGDQLDELQAMLPGAYELKVVAEDTRGLISESFIGFTINGKPIIDVTSPTNGQTFEETSVVTVDITVTDDLGLTNAQLFLDDNLLSTLETGPFTWQPNVIIPELSSLKTGQYTIKVVAMDDNGLSAESIVSFSVVTTLLSAETRSTVIYPNPVDRFLTIKDDQSQIHNIQLLDLNGKSLITRDAKDGYSRIDLADFPAGLYILNLSGEEINQSHLIYKK